MPINRTGVRKRMNLEKFTDRARGFLQSAQTIAANAFR